MVTAQFTTQFTDLGDQEDEIGKQVEVLTRKICTDIDEIYQIVR